MKGSVVILSSLGLLLGLTACGAPQKPNNMFVLLPDQDGTVGRIEVVNDKGNLAVGKAGDTVVVADGDSAPQAAPPMTEEQIRSTFREALAVEPMQPQSFLLYFKSGASELTDESLGLLPKILDVIRERQSTDISVIGHTDTAGAREYNAVLSTKRAQSVSDLLVGKGVSSAAIQVSSHGEGNLLVVTPDDVEEPKNRRVEVVVR